MNKENLIKSSIEHLIYTNEVYGNTLFLENIELEVAKVEKVIKINANEEKLIEAKVLQENKELQIKKKHEWENAKDLDSMYSMIHECTNCQLGFLRKNFVFGSGNKNADIFIIGEAPGETEDNQGVPFVGRAGQLLSKILEAINLTRDEVYIANIIKCRPPGNRRPEKNEVAECKPYIDKQIELVQPKLILLLGLTAVESLLGSKERMSDLRGKFRKYKNIDLMVTYHPAALLRNPNLKKDAWEDMKIFRDTYNEMKQG